MKKNNAIAWLVTMLMTLASSPVFAASGTNYEVEVGKTLRLNISDWGVECMANGSSYTWEITKAYVGDDTNYSEYLTFTSKSKNYAVVKGIKSGELVGIQYTGYYYYKGMRKEFYDVFYVRVVNPGTPSTGPASLEVFPTPQAMKVGETKWVYVNQTRAIGGTYFYSEDETIATVTHGELASPNSYTTAAQITAKKAGKVNVIAKNVNGLTAVCEVTVTSQSVSSVSVRSSLSIEVGDSYILTPTIYPSNAETAFAWSSDNSNVAVVSNTGRVTAKSTGTTNITVKTDNGKTATCKLTVLAKSVTSVNINSDLSLEVGETYTLTPTITPSDAVTSYTWSSDNNNVATVSQSGVVTANSEGTATITVKTNNDKTATCKLTVKAATVTEYEVIFSIYGYENGKVLYNGVQLAGSVIEDYGSFMVAEGKDVTLTIFPNEGYKIDWVWVDFEDAKNSMLNNELTLRDVRKDTYVVVAFSENDLSVGINSVYNDNRGSSANNRTIIYNLKGQKLEPSQARRGLFIVNGLKVYIK